MKSLLGGVAALALSVTTVTGSIVGLPAWDTVRSPRSEAVAEFLGVAPMQGSVWAVGSRGHRSLAAHWDGSAFIPVRTPNSRRESRVLEDIDGAAPDDIWAVGSAGPRDVAGSRTHVIHWDGDGWNVVGAPNPGGSGAENGLSAVAVISTDDAWAVGWHRTHDPGDSRALTLHWDGTSWTRVANPCGPYLRGIVALRSDRVWAVGGDSTCRWNGEEWRHFPAAPHPNPAVAIDLQDVTGTAGGGLWAVGVGATSCGEGVCHTGVIERWTDSGWRFRSRAEPLYGVHASAPDDVYAVGLGLGPAIVHYDGSGWDAVPTPTPRPIGRLLAVDAGAGGRIWAVGWRLRNGLMQPLAERAPSPDSGAVVGRTGVGNATVTWFGPETGSVASDQFGRYQAGGLDAGSYSFVATFPGCDPAVAEVAVPAGTTISVPLRISC
jgi:hypothetical protein